MKKLVIVAGLICSMAHANEYLEQKVNCTLRLDQTSISNPENQIIKELKTTYSIISLNHTRKVVRISTEDTMGLPLPSVRKPLRLHPTAVLLKFHKLDADESRELLGEAGAHGVPVLPSGFKFGKIKLKFNCGYYRNTFCKHAASKVSQIHFPTTTFDGLSYHARLNCQLDY